MNVLPKPQALPRQNCVTSRFFRFEFLHFLIAHSLHKCQTFWLDDDNSPTACMNAEGEWVLEQVCLDHFSRAKASDMLELRPLVGLKRGMPGFDSISERSSTEGKTRGFFATLSFCTSSYSANPRPVQPLHGMVGKALWYFNPMSPIPAIACCVHCALIGGAYRFTGL